MPLLLLPLPPPPPPLVGLLPVATTLPVSRAPVVGVRLPPPPVVTGARPAIATVSSEMAALYAVGTAEASQGASGEGASSAL